MRGRSGRAKERVGVRAAQAGARFRRGLVACTLVWLGSGCSVPLIPQAPVARVSATPEWFESNGPLLAEYLRTLPDSAIGQPLRGIRLSGKGEGLRWLEGQTYLGVPEGLPSGVEVRMIGDGRRVVAYVWVERGGGEYVLEPCESGEQEGIRARLAGGGPYAWKALKPEHGVVYTVCPPEEWVPDPLPSTQPR